MKLQIGKKYTPHLKSPGFHGLENSNCWRRAKEKGNNFLYYTGVMDGHHCFNHDEQGVGGDYFLESDVTEYVENIKTESMKETFTVDKEFILEAHRAACFEWEKKIEKKFPELFAKTPIEEAIKKVGSVVFGEPVRHEGNLVKIPLPTANRAWSMEVFRYVQQFLSMYPNSYPVHRKEHDTSNFMYIEFSE